MKNKTLVFSFYLLTTVFFNAHAQNIEGAGSVLWQLKHPHSSHTSYLLGTSHDFGAEWIESFSVIDSLVTTSHTFICENTLDKDTTFAKKLATALAGEKRTAREFFGENFDLVNTYFVKHNDESITAMDTSGMPKVSILYSYFFYLNNVLGEKSNFKVSKRAAMMVTMDNILKTKARAHGKEVMGLDNPEHVKAVFTSEKFINTIITGIVQYIEILNSVDANKPENSAALSWYESMRMYQGGDFRYSFKHDYPGALGDEALKQRNDDWMKVLPTQVKTKDCFIVVGIQHLDYKEGLVRQLEKAGFILTPVKLKARSTNGN